LPSSGCSRCISASVPHAPGRACRYPSTLPAKMPLCPDAMHQAMTGSESEAEPQSVAAPALPDALLEDTFSS
jgi:hypothetical protein